MIGRTNCGAGGGGKAVITVYGGANEVITYAGAETGTITLNSSGQGTAALKKGFYSFTAALSGMTIAKACENGTTVRLRPERFIYWYGVLGAVIEHTGTGSITYNDNSFKLITGGTNWAYAKSGIDCSQDTKLSVRCTDVKNVSTYCRMEYGSSQINLARENTVSLAYTYSASNQPTLRIYNYQDRYDYAFVTEWYLGEREAA